MAAACRAASATREIAGALPGLIDRAFVLRAVAWGVAAFLAFGLVTAIIPNPIFGRSVPPEPFAIAVWILSAPLMGLIAATYGRTAPIAKAPTIAAAPLAVASAPSAIAAAQAVGGPAAAGDPGRGTTTATIGSIAVFVAIGCPLCNKVALLLLGTSGALTVFAPLQPLIGAASLAMLAVTLGWRIRVLSTGRVCSAPARP